MHFLEIFLEFLDGQAQHINPNEEFISPEYFPLAPFPFSVFRCSNAALMSSAALRRAKRGASQTTTSFYSITLDFISIPNAENSPLGIFFKGAK